MVVALLEPKKERLGGDLERLQTTAEGGGDGDGGGSQSEERETEALRAEVNIPRPLQLAHTLSPRNKILLSSSLPTTT